jgi:hypothetical protein
MNGFDGDCDNYCGNAGNVERRATGNWSGSEYLTNERYLEQVDEVRGACPMPQWYRKP